MHVLKYARVPYILHILYKLQRSPQSALTRPSQLHFIFHLTLTPKPDACKHQHAPQLGYKTASTLL